MSLPLLLQPGRCGKAAIRAIRLYDVIAKRHEPTPVQ
jgi:hypothetical protein